MSATSALTLLKEQGILREIESVLLALLRRRRATVGSLYSRCALASRAPAYGHVCVNLDTLKHTIRSNCCI